MPRRAIQFKDEALAQAWRAALAEGALGPADACKAIRGLLGFSQAELAAQVGVSLNVVKAVEGGHPGVKLASLERIASALGLRMVMAAPSGVEMFDAPARQAADRAQRIADSRAVAEGRISERALHDRKALRVSKRKPVLPHLG